MEASQSEGKDENTKEQKQGDVSTTSTEEVKEAQQPEVREANTGESNKVQAVDGESAVAQGSFDSSSDVASATTLDDNNTINVAKDTVIKSTCALLADEKDREACKDTVETFFKDKKQLQEGDSDKLSASILNTLAERRSGQKEQK